jgi:mono/diheme cytochrome c family protein
MAEVKRGRSGRAALLILAIVAGLVAAAALDWWQLRPPAMTMNTTDPAMLALGADVYGRECAACHGARLEGQPDWRTRLPNGRLPAPPHDPSGHTWHHPAEQLFGMVKYGVQAYAPAGYQSDMPAYGDRLADDEIWAVLAWIKSTWPAAIRGQHDEIDRRASGR